MILSWKRLALSVVLFLLTLTGARLVWLDYHMPDEQPLAIGGVLDLRGWDMPANRTIALEGEWELFPARFDLPASEEVGKPIQVPGIWDGAFPGRQGEDSIDYGVYRLRILLDESVRETFAVRIRDVKSSSELYVNGRLAGASGRPAETTDRYEAANRPYTVTAEPRQGAIELTLRVAAHHERAGVTSPMRFGFADTVERQTSLSIGMQFMLCVLLLMHAAYGLILYFLGTRSTALLYFSCFVGSAILSVIVADDKLIFQLADVPYSWYLKSIYWSYLGVAVFIPPLIRQLLPEYGSIRLHRWLNVAFAAYAVFVLAATDTMLRTTYILLAFWMYVSIALALIYLYKAWKDKQNVIFLLLAIVGILHNMGWARIKNYTSIDVVYFPFDLLTALLLFAAFWFQRFFETNARMKQLAEQLQLEGRRKDDFLVNTSHELRNPLHGMINIAQSILDDERKPPFEAHRSGLGLLVDVGRRMSLLLNDLVDAKRLKEGTIQLQPRGVRLQAVVPGVMGMLRYMTDGKPIRLTADIPDAFPPVRADEHRLIQILFNLLHNAVKFTKEGEVSLRVERRGKEARIMIADTGPGIPEHALERIFEEYEQIDPDAGGSFGGLGLGLGISRRLVELHGGSLTAASAPGQGSVFAFLLPIADANEAPNEARHDPDAPLVTPAEADDASDAVAAERETDADAWEGVRPRVLAVDDDAVNLNVLERILTLDRYEIVKATSAPEALAKAEAERFDLVIADVMMPHMSGYALASALRERYSLSELPILLLTARNRPEDISTGFRAGANDYVVKPVDARELRSRARVLTQLKQSVGDRLRMEAAWLQAQIKPHFIFNTINSIAALSALDADRMRGLLEAFSRYLRTSFDFRNSDRLVELKRELSLVELYLYIEKERYGDRLRVEWELNANPLVPIPPLTVQPLVENAVTHGIFRRARGGTIRIRTEESDGGVTIAVSDDGVGMDADKLRSLSRPRPETGEGIGLRNIDRRLKQQCGTGLHIRSEPGSGTEVIFRIPK